MRSFSYRIATNLSRARAALTGTAGKRFLKAGGLDLLDQLKERTIAPEELIAIGSIENLDRIEVTADSLHIGATTTLANIATDPQVRTHAPALAQAAGEAGTPQVRQVATAAGNLCQRPRCWYFRSAEEECPKRGVGSTCPALEGIHLYHAILGNRTCAMVHPSNLAPALLAHRANLVVLGSQKERLLSLDDFFVNPETDLSRENVLRPDEIIRDIILPLSRPGDTPRGKSVSTYVEVRHKQSFDWPLASCTVVGRQQGRKLANVRIVLGAVAPVPWRAHSAEQLVEAAAAVDESTASKAADAALESATPLANNAYKMSIVRAVVESALLEAVGRGTR